jgi:hypothetical protein
MASDTIQWTDWDLQRASALGTVVGMIFQTKYLLECPAVTRSFHVQQQVEKVEAALVELVAALDN